MTEIISIVLPIFIVFGYGFFLKKKFDPDISSLSNVGFYCLLPALVFRTFYTSSINYEIGWLILFSLALFFAIVLASFLLAKLFRLGQSTETGLILGSSFANAGNYGSSIVLLAYGQAGFEWAITFFVIQQMLMSTFGVYIAARGKAGYVETLKKVAKMPALYAGLLGFLFQTLQIELHPVFYTPIELLSQAMIPLLMLILGMQLATIKGFGYTKGISLGVSIRLFVSPLIAYFLLMWFPFNDLANKVLLLQAAMPAAVVPTLLAIQYKRYPEMVSGITMFSTLLSAVTISVLLYLLR
jgi:predicted permease